MEVLILTKAHGSQFAAGALVFPGGKLDPMDRNYMENMGAKNDPIIEFKIAAIRELFEECGILLAKKVVTDKLIPSSEVIQIKTDNPDRGLFEIANLNSLELAIDHLLHFAHWITPQQRPKRYNTHFFVTRAPDLNTTPIVDGYEIVNAEWRRPRDILKDVYSGVLKLVLPTMMNIMRLSEFSKVEDVFKEYTNKEIICVEPKQIEANDGSKFEVPLEAGFGSTSILSKYIRSA
tara:strand:- start:402 stop:1103 length:702 start_codon:yes stop_codon:yes gene_type:complete